MFSLIDGSCISATFAERSILTAALIYSNCLVRLNISRNYNMYIYVKKPLKYAFSITARAKVIMRIYILNLIKQ